MKDILSIDVTMRIRGVRGHNLMPLKGVTGSKATTRGGDHDGRK